MLKGTEKSPSFPVSTSHRYKWMSTYVKEYTHGRIITKKSKRGVWDLKLYAERMGTDEFCLFRERNLDLLFQREIMGLFWDGTWRWVLYGITTLHFNPASELGKRQYMSMRNTIPALKTLLYRTSASILKIVRACLDKKCNLVNISFYWSVISLLKCYIKLEEGTLVLE